MIRSLQHSSVNTWLQMKRWALKLHSHNDNVNWALCIVLTDLLRFRNNEQHFFICKLKYGWLHKTNSGATQQHMSCTVCHEQFLNAEGI